MVRVTGEWLLENPGNIDPAHARLLKQDVLAAALLIMLGVIFFADLFFTSKNLYYRDILSFHYPLRKVLIDSYAEGKLPLWNPHIYLGQAMLANPNYMAFYPTNLLHLLVSFNYAFKLHFLIHPILGGLGMYFFLRRFALRSLPALAGAMAYQFSGTVLSFLNLYNLVPATALIPWIGWAFRGALQGQRSWKTLGLGCLLALQIIAFEPLLFQCCILLILALSIFYLLEQEDKRQAIRILAVVLCLATAFAIGIAAVQIFPTLELLPQSARGAGMDYSMASGWSMHPMDLLSAFIPNFYGRFFTIDSATSWGENYHELRDPYLISFFLGSVTLLLAALAIFSARTKLRNVLSIFTLLALILALGKFAFLYPFLYRYLPLFNLGRYPSKYFLLATFLISMLAALGLEAIIEHGADLRLRRSMKSILIISVIVGCVILCFGLYWNWNVESLAAHLRIETPSANAATKDFPGIAAGLARSLIYTALFLILGSFILFIRNRSKWNPRVADTAILAILAFELMPPNLGLSPYLSEKSMSDVPKLVKMMQQFGPREPFRTVTPNYLNPVPTNMVLKAPNRSAVWFSLYSRSSGQSLDGIRQGLQYSIDHTVDHLNTRESDNVMERSLNLPVADKLVLLANLNCPIIPTLGALDTRGVTLVGSVDTSSNLDYRLYRLKQFLPRAYFASEVIQAASHEEALDRLLKAGSILSDRVILESPQVVPNRPAAAASSPVSIARYENSRISCRVTANSAGYLVLLDSWYPGWKAYVDGRETEILRANYAFRAVAVAAGIHQVEFVFKPKSFYFGASITCLTLLIGIAVLIYLKRKERMHWLSKK
jgi:hypothetical protein